MTGSNSMRKLITIIEADLQHAFPPPERGMVRVYHAQSHVVPDVLNNREIKGYNSMGTWFDSNPEIDRSLYGKNVTAYDIPADGYLEPYNDFLTDALGHCLPLIQRHLGNKDAEHLEQHPWNEQKWKRWREIEQMVRDDKVPFRDEARLMRERRVLTRSQSIVRAALNNPAYCRDFRSMIENAGYRGFLWRDSKIDGMGPHDVYLLFHTDDIHPVGRL